MLWTVFFGLRILVAVILARRWRAGANLVLPSFPAFLLACALCRIAFFDTATPVTAPAQKGES